MSFPLKSLPIQQPPPDPRASAAMMEFLKRLPLCRWPSVCLKTAHGGLTLTWTQDGVDAEAQFGHDGGLECYYTASPAEAEHVAGFGGEPVRGQGASHQGAVEFIWEPKLGEIPEGFVRLVREKLKEARNDRH